MIKLNKQQMITYLSSRESYTAYFTDADVFEGVQVAPPGCFGSIRVRPDYSEDDPDLFNSEQIVIDDTSFDGDYDNDTEFCIYDKADICHMIKILSLCL